MRTALLLVAALIAHSQALPLGGIPIGAGVTKQFTSNKGLCVTGSCGEFGTTITAHYSGTTGSGSLLVAELQKNAVSAITTPCGSSMDCVTDSVNGNWTFACKIDATGPITEEIWYKAYASSLNTSATVTATATGNSNANLFIYEAIGTSGTLDRCAGAAAFGGNPITVSSFTSSSSGDLLFGWIYLGNAAEAVGGNFSYTQLDSQNSNIVMAEYAVNSGSGSTSIQFTNSSGAGSWFGIGAAFH